MALKPTIYKFNINLSDLNRDVYDSLHLTVALHPSETIERMMARVLAFCIEARESLGFTKGLSEVEEPDIWQRSLDDQILLWLDVGEPSVDRIKKASRLADTVKVYCFNSKADVWWQQSQSKISMLPVSVVQLDWAGIERFAGLVQRTMNMSVTITGESAFIATETGECEVSWHQLTQG